MSNFGVAPASSNWVMTLWTQENSQKSTKRKIKTHQMFLNLYNLGREGEVLDIYKIIENLNQNHSFPLLLCICYFKRKMYFHMLSLNYSCSKVWIACLKQKQKQNHRLIYCFVVLNVCMCSACHFMCSQAHIFSLSLSPLSLFPPTLIVHKFSNKKAFYREFLCQRYNLPGPRACFIHILNFLFSYQYLIYFSFFLLVLQ